MNRICNLLSLLGILTIFSFSLQAETVTRAKGASKGNVIGIQNTETIYDGSYLLKSQRKLFGNTKQAESKGFVAFNSVEDSSGPLGFKFDLSGSQEVPPITTEASGSCLAVLSADESSLDVKCTHNANSPTAAHIHQGAVGVSGAAICTLSNDGASPIEKNCELSSGQVAALKSDGLYINVHTTGNSSGEIRGQISNPQ